LNTRYNTPERCTNDKSERCTIHHRDVLYDERWHLQSRAGENKSSVAMVFMLLDDTALTAIDGVMLADDVALALAVGATLTDGVTLLTATVCDVKLTLCDKVGVPALQQINTSVQKSYICQTAGFALSCHCRRFLRAIGASDSACLLTLCAL